MTTKDKRIKRILITTITLFFTWTGFFFLEAGWMTQFWVSVASIVLFPYSLHHII